MMAERRAGHSRKRAQPALRSAAIPRQAQRDALAQGALPWHTELTPQGTALTAQSAESQEPALCPGAHQLLIRHGRDLTLTWLRPLFAERKMKGDNFHIL